MTTAYSVLVFYGILAIVAAAIGNYFYGEIGFTYGYVIGVLVSIGLWFTVGKAYSV